MSKYTSPPLIKERAIEARKYQENILKSALEKNTLVVAPTALGKTVIAVLLSSRFLEKLPEKKILVLAPTRPLVLQHSERFRQFLTLDEEKIGVLTGSTSPEKRSQIWKKLSVICATPHVIKNDLLNGRYSTEDLSLVVFDEAHRAVGGYPYGYISSAIDCRVLALTASPGGSPETIDAVCKALKIENVEIRDESDPDVAPYVKGFMVEWKKIQFPEPFAVIKNLLMELLRTRIRELRNKGLLASQGTNVTKKELLSLMGQLQKKASEEKDPSVYPSLSSISASITISHAIELLETQGINSLYTYLRRTAAKGDDPKSSKALKRLVMEPGFKRILAMTQKFKERFDDPKIKALKDVISETRRDTKIIVFTQYRDTAAEIVNSINEIGGVRAVRFIGQSSKAEDPGLSQKKQLEIISSFREGLYNVLVATSVAEEGLDIPSVDLVVFYEPVPSEIRSIQRRGRTGRTKVGRVVVLMMEKTRDEGFYWSGVSRERQMKKSLRKLKNAYGSNRGKITDWT